MSSVIEEADDAQDELHEALRECAIALGIRNDVKGQVGDLEREVRAMIHRYELFTRAIRWSLEYNPTTGEWEVLDSLNSVVVSTKSHSVAALIAAAPVMHELLVLGVDHAVEMGKDCLDWPDNAAEIANTIEEMIEFEVAHGEESTERLLIMEMTPECFTAPEFSNSVH